MQIEEEKSEIESGEVDSSTFSKSEAVKNTRQSVRSEVKSSLAQIDMIKNKPIQNREKAIDKIVHIEDEPSLDIPEVSRVCDQIEGLEKGYAQVDKDCKLYVEQEGKGEPIVLLHGGPGATHHYFHPHFSNFKDSARIISYDQRGCGLSDRNEGDGFSIDQAVDDLESLRKALGIERWTVLGHSYGGLLAQNYAKKYPRSCKGLVLTCASAGLMNLELGRNETVLSDEESKKISSIHSNPNLTEKQKVYNAFLNGDWKRQDRYKPTKEEMAQFALYEWDNDQNYRDSVAKEADNCDLEGAFENCPIPTLIAEGGQDMTWNTDKPKKFQQNHPNAKMVIFNESAHYPFRDEPERFFDELRDFLGGLSNKPSPNSSQWESYIAAWEDAQKNSPDNLVMELDEDPECYKKIAEAYLPNWLEQMKYSSSFREVGFALYIAGQYDEALKFFKKTEEKATHPFEIVTSLIWQGHMLDLLGRRDDAISVYKKAEVMDINENITLDQFNLTYQPSSYAAKKIREPFSRVELV